MSYLVVRGPYLPECYGQDYDSPRSRTFGINATYLRGSPGPFRKHGAGLPRWLNFKTSSLGTPPTQRSEKQTSDSKEESQIATKKPARRDSTLSTSTRSSKSANSGINLREKVDEHEMKTKTNEWKKNQDYRLIRERRKLTKKHRVNSKLRLIKRFYIPSILCIALGVIFIFGSTIHSLSDGTVFWTFKEQFRVAGLITIAIGVIMLMVTVGCESRTSRKQDKGKILKNNPLIHPDFLTEKSRSPADKYTPKKTPESCHEAELLQVLVSDPETSLKGANNNDLNSVLCSSIQSASSSISKVSRTDGLILQKIRLSNGQLVEDGWLLCSSVNVSGSDQVVKMDCVEEVEASTDRSLVFKVADEGEDEVFLRSFQ